MQGKRSDGKREVWCPVGRFLRWQPGLTEKSAVLASQVGDGGPPRLQFDLAVAARNLSGFQLQIAGRVAAGHNHTRPEGKGLKWPSVPGDANFYLT